jgi:hypothetical protein
MKLNHKTEIISKILTPALKLWLRSQLDQVEDLEININAGDTQILRGKINSVFLKTTLAVYQGIHVRKVEVATEKIGVNLGGMVRGKPFRLLQPILVSGELEVTENDLNRSLCSSLLSQGLKDLVGLLLEEKGYTEVEKMLANYELTWQNLTLNADKFILNGIVTDSQGNTNQLILCSGLELSNLQTLSLNPIYIEGIPEIEDFSLNQFTVDLGSDVQLQQLSLSEQKIYFLGKVKVNN